MSTAWPSPSISPALPPPAVCFPGDAFETSTVNFEPLRERRREVRYPTYEEVQVSLLDVSGLEVSGVLRNVSRSGFRVDLIVPVRTGARVKVSIRDKVVIFATARYCHREGDAFQVGTSIDAMFCPSALMAARRGIPNLDASPGPDNSHAAGGVCHDLARAIIEDQELFPGGRARHQANGQCVPDRMV